MTDQDVRKGLKKHSMDLCSNCKVEKTSLCNGCISEIQRKALDLINRQQAEIERLNGAVQEWVDGECLSQKHLLMIEKLQNEIEQVKSEAVKEFAEKLHTAFNVDWLSPEYANNSVEILRKEMVGEQE